MISRVIGVEARKPVSSARLTKPPELSRQERDWDPERSSLKYSSHRHPCSRGHRMLPRCRSGYLPAVGAPASQSRIEALVASMRIRQPAGFRGPDLPGPPESGTQCRRWPERSPGIEWRRPELLRSSAALTTLPV